MKTALIVVDVQNDFCMDGALEVKNGNDVIPVINELVKSNKFDIIVATQDWHPQNHKSFASNHADKKIYDVIELNGIPQVLWPDHCVQGTKGSHLHKDLVLGGSYHVFKKGMDPDIDSYSGFYDNDHKTSTGLSEFLKKNEAASVYVTGLATDYCVKYTALDSVKEGFRTYLVSDAIRGVNVNPDDVSNALREMKEVGVEIIASKELVRR